MDRDNLSCDLTDTYAGPRGTCSCQRVCPFACAGFSSKQFLDEHNSRGPKYPVTIHRRWEKDSVLWSIEVKTMFRAALVVPYCSLLVWVAPAPPQCPSPTQGRRFPPTPVVNCHQMTVPPTPGGGRTPHNSHLHSSAPNWIFSSAPAISY